MDLATKKMVYYGLVGLLIAGSTVALFQASPFQILPKDGTLSIYLSNIQPDILVNPNVASATQASSANAPGRTCGAVLSLNLTIDRVTIHKNGDTNDGGMVVSNTKFIFDVCRSFDVSTLISNSEVPVENVTMVSLHVASAAAAVQGLSGPQSVKVPSDELKIPVSPVVHIKAQMNSSIVISGTAHIVFQGNGNITLTPVLQARPKP